MALKNLDNNQVQINSFSATLADFTQSDTFVCKAIKRNFRYENEKKTENVESVAYDLVDTKTFVSFRLKVPGDSPVIDPVAFDEMDKVIKVRVPIDQTTVRPYRVEYGRATVSIVAPFVELIDNSDDISGFSDFEPDDGIEVSAK